MSVGGALVLLLGGVVAQAAPLPGGGLPGASATPAVGAPTGAAEPPADAGAETVVTATTPLHGSRLPRERVPANVQTVTADAIAARHSLDLTDYMLDALGSVSGNQVQQNPLQPDLQYRGFLASPLLGAPQGMSVYLDGVRLNEPFGDTLSWDLIPTEAIRSANLMPGSNPLYGLNTLGGALSLETKTGLLRSGRRGSPAGRLVRPPAARRRRRRPRAALGRVRGRTLFRRGRLAAVLAVAHRERLRRDDLPATARRRRSWRSPPRTPRSTATARCRASCWPADRRQIFTHPDTPTTACSWRSRAASGRSRRTCTCPASPTTGRPGSRRSTATRPTGSPARTRRRRASPAWPTTRAPRRR